MANILDIPQDFSTTLNVGGGIDGITTSGIVLTSVAGLPTDGGILCFDWANPLDTTKAEYIEYAGISGNTLTGVVRGQEGFSAKSHTNLCTVTGVFSRAHIKRLKDNFTVEHDRSGGTHTQVTSIINNIAIQQKDTGGINRAVVNLNSNNVVEVGAGSASVNDVYLVDSGTANAYVVTCTPVPLAYATGMRVKFKATNANTAVSTLNVNSLGTKTIKRYGTTDLSANDIQTGQIVEVTYDGTNFLLDSPSFTSGSSINFTTSGQQAAFTTSSTTIVDVTGATVTVNPTGSAKVNAVISGRLYSATAGDVIRISLWIDGAKIQEYDVGDSTANYGVPFCLSGQASVASGARIIKMSVYNATAARQVTVDAPNVNVIWA